MKKCSKCGDIKEFSEFYEKKGRKDGLYSECKTCVKHRNKELKTNPEMQLQKAITQSIILENKLLKKDGKKICNCCKNIFEITTTSRYCEECQKKYYEKNKEKIKYESREYYGNNKEKVSEQHKKHYEKNKEKMIEQRKEYNEKNKEKIRKQQREYRLKKKLATP